MINNIGFIGLGVMGKNMAKHIMNKGYSLNIYNRTKEKGQELIDLGATWCNEIKTLAKRCELIITMVGYPTDVEEIYFGSEGILENAQEGSILIDMTTSKPSLALRIAKEGVKRGLHVLDAPVSGGDVGAKNGTLTIMVGGEAVGFELARPILEAMGKNILMQGGASCGQHTKMCNQIAIASNMMGVCEAMVYATHAGLDPNTVLKSISHGAAGSWSLTNLAPRMIQEDFEPGFYVKHFVKDMKIAIEESKNMGYDLPGLNLAKKMYDKLVEQDLGDKGTQILFKLLQEYKPLA